MKVLKLYFLLNFLFIFKIYSYAQTDNNFQNFMKNFQEKNRIPGMSIAVLDNGKTEIYNYGYANEIKKIKTTSNTIYRINSFTKTLTATLAGIAQAEGKLKLRDPFVSYFPETKQNNQLSAIKISDLLAHVASMPSAFDPDPKSFSDLIVFLKNFEPSYPIGTKYKYSQYIGLVGYVLQNVYHEPYEKILNEKLIQPLKLQSTYLNIPKSKETLEALGHNEDKIIPIRKEIPVLFAAGDVKSTIVDMAKFLQAQMETENISHQNLYEGIRVVHNKKICFENTNLCQQMAWQEHEFSDLDKAKSDTIGDYVVGKNQQNLFLNKITFIDKTGGGAGMSSYMAYIPALKKGVVILLNKNIGDARIAFGREILKSFNLTN